MGEAGLGWLPGRILPGLAGPAFLGGFCLTLPWGLAVQM